MSEVVEAREKLPYWDMVGECKVCGSPFIAQMRSITVPVVHKTCTCAAPRRRTRKSKAPDGLPRVEPDRETKPLFGQPGLV